MKATYLLFALGGVVGCRPDVVRLPAPAGTTNRPVLNIVVNDLSQSASWLQLDTAELSGLLLRDSAPDRGGELAGITITENSREQQPFISPVLRCATRPRGGNFYRQRQIDAENLQARAEYARTVATVVDSFARRIVLPRDRQFSDVAGALEMARILAAQPSYAGYEIRLVILSDLVHDVPGGGALRPVEFPAHVTIYVVGKSPAVDLSYLFPGCRAVELAVFRAHFIHA